MLRSLAASNPHAAVALPVPLTLDVEARLGDVRFEGLGIEVELDGAPRVERTVQGRWLLEGTTAIEEGTFSAYG